MKAKSAFDHPVTGAKIMPGQTVDEKGLDKEHLEDLKTRGYTVDGDGYKAGEKPDFEKLSANELTAYAQALGIDTGGLRDRNRIVGAINAKTTPASPASGEQHQTAVTFGPGTRAHEEDRTLSPEDYAKQQQDIAKARADSEKSMAQSAGNKEKAAEAAKLVEQAGKAKAPPPERRPAAHENAKK